MRSRRNGPAPFGRASPGEKAGDVQRAAARGRADRSAMRRRWGSGVLLLAGAPDGPHLASTTRVPHNDA
eukprot:7698848-Lingulodinium_polyedra.AAC.1